MAIDPNKPLGLPSGSDIVLSDYEKRDLLKDLKDTYRVAVFNQAPIRWRWRWVRNYVGGMQLYDPGRGQYVGHRGAMLPSDTGSIDDENIIINDMMKVHLVNVQRLSSYEISPDVLPNSNDPSDKKGARLASALIEDLFRRTGQANLKRKIAAIVDKYGCVFLKTTFDPTEGDMVPKLVAKDGAVKESDTEFEKDGRMVLDVVSPENIILPRFTPDMAKADWVQEINVRPTDYVFRRYNKTIDSQEIQIDQIIMSALTDIGKNKADNPYFRIGKEEGRCILNERWYRPCPRFPKGAIIVWAANEILRVSNLTDYYDDIPYHSAQLIFDEKDALGDSILWHLIPIQDLKNKAVSQVYRHNEVMAQNKILVETQSRVNKDDINNQASQILEYSETKPEWMQPPPIDPTVVEMAGLMDAYREVLSSSNDISRRGKTPSGNAISAMTELDSSIFQPTLESIEEALEKACTFILRHIPKYYNVAHVVKSGGGARPWVVNTFIGDEIRQNFDAKIRLMSGLPVEKLARLQFLLQLFQSHVVSLQDIRPYLEFGQVDESLKQLRQDQEAAEEIVERLSSRKTAKTVVVHQWDNQPLIVELLIRSMREGYDFWPKWQQEVFQIQLHLRQDLLAAMQKQTPSTFVGPQGGRAFTAPNQPPTMMPDTYQDASQQPPPGSVPPAFAPGFQNVGAGGQQ